MLSSFGLFVATLGATEMCDFQPSRAVRAARPGPCISFVPALLGVLFRTTPFVVKHRRQ